MIKSRTKTIIKCFFLLIICASLVSSCTSSTTEIKPVADNSSDKEAINAMLDSFNLAAARADYNKYFDYYTDDAIFIGTDATENWNKKDFMIWAKPAFDKGRAWNFTSLQRNIFFDKTAQLAWFDELLNTQMKLCRGSGVLVKKGNDWKVQQYVLSMTMPNDLIDTIVKLKGPIEDSLMRTMTGNRQ